MVTGTLITRLLGLTSVRVIHRWSREFTNLTNASPGPGATLESIFPNDLVNGLHSSFLGPWGPGLPQAVDSRARRLGSIALNSASWPTLEAMGESTYIMQFYAAGNFLWYRGFDCIWSHAGTLDPRFYGHKRFSQGGLGHVITPTAAPWICIYLCDIPVT